MSYKFFHGIKFDFGPLLQGQTGSFSLAHTGTYIRWIHFLHPVQMQSICCLVSFVSKLKSDVPIFALTILVFSLIQLNQVNGNTCLIGFIRAVPKFVCFIGQFSRQSANMGSVNSITRVKLILEFVFFSCFLSILIILTVKLTQLHIGYNFAWLLGAQDVS